MKVINVYEQYFEAALTYNEVPRRAALVMLIAKLCMWDRFVAGYAPRVISIFLVGGIQLGFLGFLGEYVMSMNIRLMNRPLVVEEKRINFDQNTDEAEKKDQTVSG